MTRFVFAVLAALVMELGANGAPATEPVRRPNILFVLIDDMGYGDLSCFGGQRVKTPAIDRLASEGIRFTQFYVNAPICSPSRVAFTTGQYPNRWGITSYLDKRQMNRRRGMADWLSPEAPSLARFLSQAGYYTAHVGKWHMGGQRDVGDAPPITAYGFATSLTNFEGLGERVLPVFEPHKDGRKFDHEPTRMSAELGGGPIHWIERHKVTAYYVDRTLEEMRVAEAGGKPFYINLWLDDVHSPAQAPPGMRGDGSPAANYLGVVKEMDRQLERVFDFVRSRPAMRDNTIILVASDNGPELGLGVTGGLRGSKGNLYEGGIRLPLIVWSAKVARSVVGSRNDKTVLAGMDVAPSVLALAGVRPPEALAFDGMDLSAAMIGQGQPERGKPIMWVRPPDRPGPKHSWPDLAIRERNSKLLVFRDGSRPELFDIAADPSETTNLAEKHAEIVQRLSKTVIEWDKGMPGRSKTK
jgi:arylsulfatase A-like enzyme